MTVRDQLLKNLLQKPARQNQSTGDVYESPKPYKRWTPGIRTLLRLRYLAHKKTVLTDNKDALNYEVGPEELQQQVAQKLDSSNGNRTWLTLMRPAVAVPLMIAAAAIALYAATYAYKAALDKQVFRLEIPRFSDTVYRLKAAQSADGSREQTQALESTVKEERQRILDYFEDHPSITETLQPLLDAVQEKEFPPQDFFALVKQLNDALFIKRIPYYLSPTVEAADCAHLPLTSFLQRIFGGNPQGSGETCIVYVLLTFHVEEHRYYNAEQYNHLAFFTRRLDEFDINDNILGKVHLGDNTAQILLSNIDATSASSTVAVNDGLLQTKLMPEGMSDVYGLESIARRLQTRVVNLYTDELKNSWRWKLSRAFDKIGNRETTVLPAATAKLQRRVADVTAFHEVQHLIDQFNDIQEPPWFAESLAQVAKNNAMPPQFQGHVLWELSAFFTHLANGEELQGILLNEFTAITLNPMLQDQPHYYSIRILLPILRAMHEGTLTPTPPDPALTLSDVASDYKYLSQQSENLGQIARDAYQILFERELPYINEIAVARRTVETEKSPRSFQNNN